MNNKKGFTLVELLVTLVISAILFLFVGVISQTSLEISRKLLIETEVFNDLTHSLRVVQNHFRSATSFSVDTVNNFLVLNQPPNDDKEVYGRFPHVKQNPQDDKKWDFNYVWAKSTGNVTEVLFSTNEQNFRLSWIDTDPADAVIQVRLYCPETQCIVPFDMKSNIFKRTK